MHTPALSCNDFSEPATSSVRWTLVSDTGTTKQLATCYGLHNCTVEVDNSLMDAYWTESMISYVRFGQVGPEFSGTVVCAEVFSNGTEESASCRLRVVRE